MLLPNFTAVFGPARATLPQRRALLRLIATAAEHRVPLPGLVAAWADEQRGRQRIRLKRLSESLLGGTALPDALERHPTLLSEEETLMVRFASESGTLVPTLRRWLDRSNETANLAGGNARRLIAYSLMLVLVGLPISVFIQTFLTPQLIGINDEYFLSTPTLLKSSQSLGDWVPLASVTWLVVLLVLLWSRVFDWPLGYVRRFVAPRVSTSYRGRQIANVLRTLGESARAGRPVAGAVATLARYHYDPALRHQLLYLRNELSLGAEVWTTLQGQGLINAKESAALVAADRIDARGWTLEALADTRLASTRVRLAWGSAIASLIVVFAFGAFVAFQAVAVFMFLSRMIEALG